MRAFTCACFLVLQTWLDTGRGWVEWCMEKCEEEGDAEDEEKGKAEDEEKGDEAATDDGQSVEVAPKGKATTLVESHSSTSLSSMMSYDAHSTHTAI